MDKLHKKRQKQNQAMTDLCKSLDDAIIKYRIYKNKIKITGVKHGTKTKHRD
jgi:hypothetical protein